MNRWPLFVSLSSSVFLHVLLKSEWRIDLFRSTPVRLVPVQYLPGPGLELLDPLVFLDLDHALALVFDWRDRAPDSPGRAAAAATSSTRSTTSTISTTSPLALQVLLVLIVPCDPVTL